MKYLHEAGIEHKKKMYFEPPFHCEFGNIEAGESFYANAYCTMLDVGKITIGDNVLFGPFVCLYTAGHPQSRKSAYDTGYRLQLETAYGLAETVSFCQVSQSDLILSSALGAW